MRAPDFRSFPDGRMVALLRATPRDAGGVQEFVARLSPQSRRERWFAPLNRLSERELARITAPAGARDASLVARDRDGRIVALAENVVDESGGAEFAIVVDEDWRRVGLGSALVGTLLEHAALAGVRALHALVLGDNPAMLGLAARFGFSRRRERDPRLVRIEKPLVAPAFAGAATGATRELTWNMH